MRVHASRLGFAGLTAGALLFYAGMAQAAMDAKKVADSMVSAVATNGKKASYTKAAAAGNDVVITGWKIINTTGETFDAANVVITNPAERQSGGFTSSKVSFDGGKITDKGRNITWATGAMEGVTVMTADEMKDNKRTPFSRLSMASLNISGGDLKAPVTIGTVSIAFADIKDGTPADMKLSVTGINLPAVVVAADPKVKATLDQLGYTSGFIASVTIDGSYNRDNDTANLKTFTLQADKVGKLTFGSVISGMPMSKLSNSDKASELLATALLNSASIRFDNDGVVEKVLDMQAKSMGVDRKTFVGSIGGMMPLLLGQAKISPAFSAKLTPAVTTFLNDPKSLQIISAPAAPVPAMKLMEAAGKPETLPEVLSLDVKANQ